MALKTFKADDNEIIRVDSRINKTVINSSKNLMYVPNIRAIGKFTLLTFNAKKAFNYL